MSDAQIAMQEEIGRLTEHLAERGVALVFQGEQLQKAVAERDELRAKLKALEEQKPVATKIKRISTSTGDEIVHIMEHVDSNLPIGTVFYLAAGAKHD